MSEIRPSTHIEETSPERSGSLWAAVITLGLITILTCFNAVHDSLVLDDKVFVAGDRATHFENLGETFNRDVWGRGTARGGLYRPLLLVDFELESRWFGSRLRAYHAVNVALHLAVTLALFGFLRMLLLRSGKTADTATLAALLAALVFAVHPVHAEVVNSVFNRSSMYVSLSAILGLWWLFRHLESRPARAWLGLGLFYTAGMFFKESALVIPGLAVALIVIFGPGRLHQRVFRFLPVFWLLIPIAVYFWLRSMALDPGNAGAAADTAIQSEFAQLLSTTDLPDPGRFLAALGVWGGALKLVFWPHPLQLYYALPTGGLLAALIAGQLVLATLAFILLARGRPALAAGLSFFYIALVPASRLVSMDSTVPHLADRYVYFPSVGLALALAFAFAAALNRWSARIALGVTFPVALLLAMLAWERNHEWGSQSLLFETDYARGNHTLEVIGLLVGEHQKKGRHGRVAEICNENPALQETSGELAYSCGTNFLLANRIDEGVASLEKAVNSEAFWIPARMQLAEVLFSQRKLQEAADQYTAIINGVDDAADKETFKGILWVKLYPKNKERLLEAKAYLERALELKPDHEAAKNWLDHVSAELESGSPEGNAGTHF